MKKSPNFPILLKKIKHRLMPVMRHFFFAYIMLLIAAVGMSFYFVTNTFSFSDADFRQQKEAELLRDVSFIKDEATVDKVLQLHTANAGPIVPNYVPTRDNPFIE